MALLERAISPPPALDVYPIIRGAPLPRLKMPRGLAVTGSKFTRTLELLQAGDYFVMPGRSLDTGLYSRAVAWASHRRLDWRFATRRDKDGTQVWRMPWPGGPDTRFPRVVKQECRAMSLTDAQVKHLVDRFLGWRLPQTFAPDGGITFERHGNKGTPHQYERSPTGTNLLDATQAETMVRYMLEGMPGT